MHGAELVITLTGIFGALLVLLCFVLNLMGRISPNSWFYLGANFVGAVLVGFNALWFTAYPALLINVVWMIAAAWKMVSLIRADRPER